jgi:hypothetical protein
MRATPTALLFAATFFLLPGASRADDTGALDAKVATIVKNAQAPLEALAAQSGVVAETQARNKAGLDPDAAKALQARWTAPDAKDADFRAYLDNRATPALRKAMKRIPGLSKLFSLDKDGNVVASLPKCHDFIHGYQPKFIECFKGGSLVVNKPALDLTSKKYSVQVSVPVKDASGVIGVLVGTFGIK